jgi:hypothetical protein
MIDFIKWCFRDTTSGFVTIIVVGLFFESLIRIIKSFKEK